MTIETAANPDLVNAQLAFAMNQSDWRKLSHENRELINAECERIGDRSALSRMAVCMNIDPVILIATVLINLRRADGLHLWSFRALADKCFNGVAAPWKLTSQELGAIKDRRIPLPAAVQVDIIQKLLRMGVPVEFLA